MDFESREGDGREPFGAYLALVAVAEACFAVLVLLALGRPPEVITTVGFGLAMAGALALQRRAQRPSELGPMRPNG